MLCVLLSVFSGAHKADDSRPSHRSPDSPHPALSAAVYKDTAGHCTALQPGLPQPQGNKKNIKSFYILHVG